MTTTLLDIITESFGEVGVLDEVETPTAAQAAQGLRKMNGLMDMYKAERLLIGTVVRTTATLTASQSSFTVGASGNINIARPVFIDHVNYVDNSLSPALEINLGRLLTDEEYQAIPVKSLTSTRPSCAYYNPTYPTGTLYPFPIPTASSLLWAVYYAAAVDEFAAVSDTVALPPGYRRMLVLKLALELARSYDRPVSPLLVMEAEKAMATVKRSNERAQVLKFPAEATFGAGGGYRDIRNGI